MRRLVRMGNMDDRKYAENLGRLVNNMQELEMLLRATLFQDEIARGISKQTDKRLVQGEIIPENAYTNWDTLGALIQKYNKLTISTGLTIDETLVDIRDAIAHGRVFAYTPTGISQLVRFYKPENNQVKVKFSVSMTDEWFGKAIGRFYDAIRRVDSVHKKQHGMPSDLTEPL